HHLASSPMSFDRVTRMGPALEACIYELDVREVRGAEAARQLLSRTRERVRAGWALRPEAAHYVNVTAAEPVDEAVRTEMRAKLGDHDGIDSVAVTGLDAGDGDSALFDDLFAESGQQATADAAHLGRGWARVVDAMQRDAPLVATVLTSGRDEIRV